MAKFVRLLYANVAEGVTVSATSEATGFPATSAVDRDRTSTWKANANGTQDLIVDLGSAQGITGIGLANHNVGTLTGTQEIRASTDNFGASNVAIKTIVPGATGDYFADFAGTQTFRYWKLRTVATGSQRAYVGEFFVGTIVELAENPDVGSLEGDAWQTQMSQAMSGVKVVKKLGRQTSYFKNISNPTTAALRSQLRTVLLAQDGPLKPFFLIPRDDAGSGTEGLAYYVRFALDRWDRNELYAGTWAFEFATEEQQ